MSDDFYRAFEEKHRGSRELIKSRLRVYMPFIEPLLSIYEKPKAIDLGCGRGEWLELLQESGFDAQGVDLDDGMLAACRDLGLNVATADAVAALKALPDASQIVVSGFHIAEHIQFSDLQTLVQEALRVLNPAGLLILETPNPENIVVGTCNFYLDPTHRQPIPPQLMAFLPEYYGFARTKILRLQEAADLSDVRVLSLKDVLGGASPDYAVVAQKAADENILAATSQAFEPEYGISLEALADRYDGHVTARALQAETTAHAAESRALQAETIAHAAESRALQVETTVQAEESRALQVETKAQQAGAQAVTQEQRAIAAEQAAQHWHQQATQWHEQILALHGSKSWRITRPLRAIRRLVTGDFSVLQYVATAAKHKTKQILRPVGSSGIAYTYKRLALRSRLKALVMRFPWLYQRLRRVAVNTGVLGGRYGLSTPVPPIDYGRPLGIPPELQTISLRTRQIYIDLKAAIENKNKEGV